MKILRRNSSAIQIHCWARWNLFRYFGLVIDIVAKKGRWGGLVRLITALWWQSRLLATTIIFPGSVTGVFLATLARVVVLASPYQFSQVANKKVNNLFKWGMEIDDILLSFSSVVILMFLCRRSSASAGVAATGKRSTGTQLQMTILIGRWGSQPSDYQNYARNYLRLVSSNRRTDGISIFLSGYYMSLLSRT